jgi:hypothetical protein
VAGVRSAFVYHFKWLRLQFVQQGRVQRLGSNGLCVVHG